MSACPKCRFELEEGALECPACGIVIKKYLALGTGPVATAPAAPAAPGTLPDRFPDPAPSGGSENPYAPPIAEVAPRSASAGESVPTADVITRLTVESLLKARPWLRFQVIYGSVVLGFAILGGIASLFLAPGGSTGGLMLFLVYLFYGVIGIALLLPLSASTKALQGLGTHRTSGALEEFAVHQSKFWRRLGILTAVVVSLMILIIVILLVGVGASIVK